MVRQVEGAYQHKRSKNLLKDKFFEEEIFTMIAKTRESGKVVAALKTEAGDMFLAPTVGTGWDVVLPSQVVVRHTGYVLGMPQNPIALCVV